MKIEFDPIQFKIDYPQFIEVSDSKLTNLFNYNASVISQPVASLFKETVDQYYWICVVLAHILTLEMDGIMGRLNTAKQGSEALNFDMNTPAGFEWWASSPYGQQVMQVMRTFIYGGHYVSNGTMPYSGDAMNAWGRYNGAWDIK